MQHRTWEFSPIGDIASTETELTGRHNLTDTLQVKKHTDVAFSACVFQYHCYAPRVEILGKTGFLLFAFLSFFHSFFVLNSYSFSLSPRRI
ncbi:hypothetical protein BDV25DRAFT_158138 [Aspergillus avenaceus]|uniref:Uncharacterized protein n=1 Tax=Aspergillus avenaceus TaxID=36643 RepID=A0A5N6TQV3_ASPAV|nr:hypothetical protein BDV25DRAFT_158138 [Aspergillus avenaceus]